MFLLYYFQHFLEKIGSYKKERNSKEGEKGYKIQKPEDDITNSQFVNDLENQLSEKFNNGIYQKQLKEALVIPNDRIVQHDDHDFHFAISMMSRRMQRFLQDFPEQ